MKKIAIKAFLFLLLAFYSFPVFSQYSVGKLDAFGLVTNLPILRLAYERSFTKTVSLGIGFETGKYASSSTGSITGPMVERYKVTGWGLVPEVRIYPFNAYKPAPIGFFIGSHFRYRSLKEVGDLPGGAKEAKAYAFNFGFNTGYKIRISQFIMDIVLGYGPSGGAWRGNKGSYSFKHFEDKMKIEFSVGFVFPEIPRKDKSGKYLYL